MSTTALTASRVPNNLRFRRTFGRIKKIIDIPNLIEIQKRSYEEFLQKDVAPEVRKDQGLQAVFKSVFPIKDFNETASLEFVSYTLSEPKYDVEECHQRGMTFAAPLKVTVQLVIWDVDPESGVRSIKNVKEQEVYFGEIPLMTRHGTFMINGTERVIVSQLHRSPGVFFDHDKGKTHASGKLLYSARIIPYRGSWIDFEFDPKDILYVRIDRRRKFHATVLLRALGMTAEDLLNYFYRKDTIILDGRKAAKRFVPDHLVGVKATRDLRNPQSNELIVKEGRKFTRAALRQMEQAGLEQIPIALEEVLGRVAAHDVKDPRTGEVLLATNEEITDEKLEVFRQRGINKVEVLFLDDTHIGPSLRNTLLQDKIEKPEDAILEIDRLLQQPLLQPRALRPLARRALEAQPQAEAERPPRPGDAPARGHPGGRPLPDRAQERQRPDRRHRPPGQPPRARRRRAGREPVPHRSRAHGARHQGAHEPAGHRDADAAGAHQLQASVGRDQGVLRVLPALAVHGPDEPALRDHPQVPPLRPRPGRAHARARGVRGARRPSHPLRPRVPDRDAGRAEHRPHRLALDLRARERVRLRRDALPPREGGAGERRDHVPLRTRGGGAHHRAGERAARRAGLLHRRSRLRAHRRRVHHGDAGQGRVHGRVAEPAGVGGGVADPVPR